jgi:DNA-binding LacI/PurR family transcriptional regulator
LINRTLDDVPAVLIPSGDGMVQAVDHLVDVGHRSIVYLGGPSHTLTAQSRLGASTTTCARRGVTAEVMGPFQPDFAAAGQEVAEDLVRGGHRAVIADNDQIAVGLMKGLAQQGLRAGRDLSVIGFDDSWCRRC